MTSALLNQLSAQFFDPKPLCIHSKGVLSRGDFWQLVAQKSVHLQKQPTKQYALWTDDVMAFLSWLMAAVLADKTVILPPHQPFLNTLLTDKNTVLLDADTPFVPHSWTVAPNIQTPPPSWQHALQRPTVVFYTSGSTGTPKAICRTLSELLAESFTLLAQFVLFEKAMFYRSVSHQHAYGLIFGLFVPLCGQGVIYGTQLSSPEMIDQPQNRHQNRPSVLVSSPALLGRCAGIFDFNTDVILSAGGRLRRSASVQYKTDIIEIFGSSETGAVGFRDGKTDDPFMPFLDIKISLSNTQTLTIISTRSINPAPQITQDQGKLTSDGGFYLLGRSDRIIKLEEKRLSLDAIEDALNRLPDVADCHVLSVVHGKREFLSAVVVLTPSAKQQLQTDGKKTTVSRLKSALRSHLEPIALPKHWRFVSSITKNSQGKINKQQMTELFKPQPPPDDRYPQKTTLHESCLDITLWVTFSPTLRCFKGHFDGFPIYPGVGQVGFLVHFSQEKWTDLVWCMALEQIKFSELIRPNDTLTLTLKRQDHKVSFALHKDDKTAATGRLVFALTNDNTDKDRHE